MKKTFCKIAAISFLLPLVSIAQENEIEQNLMKSGYILSVQSTRLKILRNELTEIRKKNAILNEANSPVNFHITLLIENIFLAETICAYEGLLLGALESMDGEKKNRQYRLQYSRLEKDTLKRLYQNFKSTQANFAGIDDKEIIILSDKVKKELLKVLMIVEEVINILQSQVKSTP